MSPFRIALAAATVLVASTAAQAATVSYGTTQGCSTLPNDGE